MDYWEECVIEALDEAGLSATDLQISGIVEFVKGAHETYGMAFGHDCIPDPLLIENEQLKIAIKKERDKVICPECKGKKIIISLALAHDFISSCSRCGGEGRLIL